MIFRSAYCPTLVIVSCPGSREKVKYLKRKVDGIDTLVVADVVDQQALINEAAKCLDLYSIIARSVNDPSVLAVRSGSYGDFTQEPKSLMELFDNNQMLHNQFVQLPDDLQSAFGYSYDNFVRGLSDGRVLKFFQSKVKKSDVKEGASDVQSES